MGFLPSRVATLRKSSGVSKSSEVSRNALRKKPFRSNLNMSILIRVCVQAYDAGLQGSHRERGYWLPRISGLRDVTDPVVAIAAGSCLAERPASRSSSVTHSANSVDITECTRSMKAATPAMSPLSAATLAAASPLLRGSRTILGPSRRPLVAAGATALTDPIPNLTTPSPFGERMAAVHARL